MQAFQIENVFGRRGSQMSLDDWNSSGGNTWYAEPRVPSNTWINACELCPRMMPGITA